VAGPRLMRLATWQNLKALVVFWLIGASLVGIPVVCLLLVLRGFVVGFTVAFLAQELGAKGFWLSLLGVVPANLVILPAFLVVAVASFTLAGQVARGRRSAALLSRAYGAYALTGGVALLLVLLGSVFEAYVSPGLLGALWPYMAG
jgi:stage II sporulation protein M